MIAYRFAGDAARRLTLMIALAAITALVLALPQAAGAQGPAETDPSADSPAGVQYQLPFDRARQDAAPRDRRRGSGRGSGSGRAGSGSGRAGSGSGSGANGSGSGQGGAGAGSADSADQPGGAGDSADAAQGADSVAQASASAIRSENNFGSSSQIPGLFGAQGAGGAGAGDGPVAASAGGGSELRTYGLLGLLVLVGGSLGALALLRRSTGEG